MFVPRAEATRRASCDVSGAPIGVILAGAAPSSGVITAD